MAKNGRASPSTSAARRVQNIGAVAYYLDRWRADDGSVGVRVDVTDVVGDGPFVGAGAGPLATVGSGDSLGVAVGCGPLVGCGVVSGVGAMGLGVTGGSVMAIGEARNGVGDLIGPITAVGAAGIGLCSTAGT